MVLLLLSLLLGLEYLQIRNDCTSIKMLACRTSPTPLGGAGKKVTLEPGVRVQEAAQFCTLFPSLLSSYYWCLGTQGGNQDATVGCYLLGVAATGASEDHCIVSKVLFIDGALPWTLHCVEPMLPVNPSVKLLEFTLPVIIIYPPKSSYSALASLSAEVGIPFHRADTLGLMSGRKVLNWVEAWMEKKEEGR